jgi:hypothetical protein
MLVRAPGRRPVVDAVLARGPAQSPTPPAAPPPSPRVGTSGRPKRTSATSRPWWVLLAVAGLVLLAVAGMLVATQEPSITAAPVGTLPAAAAREPGDLRPGAPLRVPFAGSVPVRLELPARGTDAPVVPVSTGPDGGLAVPEAPRTVGWWEPGALAGSGAGTVVVAGHVDSRLAGIGVLAVLPQLTVGEPVVLRDADGRAVTYRVVARREFVKAALPPDTFARSGPPRLVLVTCGGRFDPAARSYEDNIVVYAEPG